MSSDTSCNLSQTGDQNGVNPKLGPLADYGGSMLTHILLPDSPAINTGTSSGAPATDQRGKPRPSGLIHDKGAVERQPNDVLWIYLPMLLK